MAFNLLQHLSSLRASMHSNLDVVSDIITDEMANEKLLSDRPFVYYRNWPASASQPAHITALVSTIPQRSSIRSCICPSSLRRAGHRIIRAKK